MVGASLSATTRRCCHVRQYEEGSQLDTEACTRGVVSESRVPMSGGGVLCKREPWAVTRSAWQSKPTIEFHRCMGRG
eukprot:6378148-Lingulodinium_polyedra.AAC.1